QRRLVDVLGDVRAGAVVDDQLGGLVLGRLGGVVKGPFEILKHGCVSLAEFRMYGTGMSRGGLRQVPACPRRPAGGAGGRRGRGPLLSIIATARVAASGPQSVPTCNSSNLGSDCPPHPSRQKGIARWGKHASAGGSGRLWPERWPWPWPTRQG